MTRAYSAIFSARCRTLLQYRAAALAGLACQMFWGLIRVAIFSTFYALSPHDQPMTLPEIITYVWLCQAFIRLLPFGADGDVRAQINSGSIVYELTRPVDLYMLWYSRSVANLSAPVVLRCLPIVAVAAVFFGLQAPASIDAGLACAAAMLCGLLLSAAFQTLLTISLLWTISGDGIARVALVGMWIFSGIVLPLLLFPNWIQPVLNVLPFRGILDLPFRLYTGNIPVTEAASVFAHQLIWTVVLIVIGRAILACGTRRLVIQGG
jgi:ABC-2 type transport system permease protein